MNEILRLHYNSSINRHTSNETIIELFEDESKHSLILKLGGTEAGFHKSSKEFGLLEYLICNASGVKNHKLESHILEDLAISQRKFDDTLSNIRKLFNPRDFEQFVIKISPVRSTGETEVKFYVVVSVPDFIKLV